MSDGEVSWSEITGWRAECHGRFGPVSDLPIVDLGTAMGRLLTTRSKILDVGAGAQLPLKHLIDTSDLEYFTLDTDPRGDFDFGNLSEVPHDLRFDLAVANQVLEHLPVDHAVALVRDIAEVLVPGGLLAATVPNAAHPVRQWADATHVTAWPVFDLYGLLRLAGLDVETIARYGKRSLSRNPLRRVVMKAVAEEFRVDWMDSILIVGRRPEKTA